MTFVFCGEKSWRQATKVFQKSFFGVIFWIDYFINFSFYKIRKKKAWKKKGLKWNFWLQIGRFWKFFGHHTHIGKKLFFQKIEKKNIFIHFWFAQTFEKIIKILHSCSKITEFEKKDKKLYTLTNSLKRILKNS